MIIKQYLFIQKPLTTEVFYHTVNSPWQSQQKDLGLGWCLLQNIPAGSITTQPKLMWGKGIPATEQFCQDFQLYSMSIYVRVYVVTVVTIACP